MKATRLTIRSTDPPAWVPVRQTRELTSDGVVGGGTARLRWGEQGGFGLLSLVCPHAADLGPEAMQRAAGDAYATLLRQLTDFGAGPMIRFWNHVPSIHRRDDDPADLDRYMRFNAGRHAALAAHHAGAPSGHPGASHAPQPVDHRIVTASAVGHLGDDLVIHALTAPRPAAPIENPRQVPAYRYSARYGPCPPCFARGAALPDHIGPELDRAVIIGGTASVLGETSVHLDELAPQLEETARNIAALLSHARGAATADRPDCHHHRDPDYDHNHDHSYDHECADPGVLDAVRELRAYVVREADIPAVAAFIDQRFPCLQRLELMHAPLCRPDLLVEIEGVTRPRFLPHPQADPQAAASRSRTPPPSPPLSPAAPRSVPASTHP